MPYTFMDHSNTYYLLIILSLIFPIMIGCICYIFYLIGQRKRERQAYEIEKEHNKDRPPKTTNTSDQQSIGNLSLAERDKIIKSYQQTGINLSTNILDTYRILEFNNRQQFIDFINTESKKDKGY